MGEKKVCGDCLGGNIGKKFHDSDWNMAAKKRHKPRGIYICLDCGSDDVVSIKELLDRAREEEKKNIFTGEELRYLLEIIQLDYSLATMYQQREKSDIGGKLLRELSKLTTK